MKHRKIIYSIFLIIIVIIFAFFFWPKNKKINNEKINLVQSVTETEEKEQTIITELPPIIVDQYLISKNYEIIPKDPKGNKKIVLLTIDDGPSSQAIQMMKILEAHNIKAIFFINGMHDKANPGVIEEEAKEGFPIGNHTWSHINLKNSINNTLVDKEINDNSNLIKEKSASLPRFFRSPFGMSNIYSRNIVKQGNMISMNWSDAAKDWEKTAKNQDVFIKNVIDELHPGSIILIHEHPWSLANLDALLTTIEQKGYTFADPNNIVE